MDNAIRFLSDTGDFFASEPQWSASWERSRRDLLYAIWTSMLKGPQRRPRGTVAWFGHKTPRHDRYWEFYRGFFGDPGPNYVFCMRNFVDHYLSLVSMKDHRSLDGVAGRRRIDRAAEEYRASISRYAEMKAAIGDSVSLFILDDLREGGIDYLRRALFERLGIEVDDQTLSRIDVSSRKNSTEGVGASRRKELTPDERRFIDENEDLLQGLDALRAAKPLPPVRAAEPGRSRLSLLGGSVFSDRRDRRTG